MNTEYPGNGISIVTACYNHGAFIDETINSIRNHQWSVPVEHIVVNDGSTDEKTLAKLEAWKQKGLKIIDQDNGGPAKARNTGISASIYKYILPLDSDNWLFPAVFEKAYQLMEQDKDIDVVYTDAVYTGERKGAWQPGEINILSFLALNQIDNCALIRKDRLQTIGMYDESRIMISYEDWELWLRMLFNNCKFYYLKETGFCYRVINTSLSFSTSRPNDAIMKEYIVKKHAADYAKHYQELVDENGKFIFLKKYLADNKMKSIFKILTGKPLV